MTPAVAEERPGDGLADPDPRASAAGGREKRLGGDDGLHLRILGVVHGGRDGRVQRGLEPKGVVVRERPGVDPGVALGRGEIEQRLRSGIRRRDDDSALPLVLDGREAPAELGR